MTVTMVRLGDLLIEVRNEIQRGIDAIEIESDAADREGPNVEVAAVELDIPFGMEEPAEGEPPAEEALMRTSSVEEGTESPAEEEEEGGGE